MASTPTLPGVLLHLENFFSETLASRTIVCYLWCIGPDGAGTGGTEMDITKNLVSMRNEKGVDDAEYVAACEAQGRCPQHPAYAPDYCPLCGTARQI